METNSGRMKQRLAGKTVVRGPRLAVAGLIICALSFCVACSDESSPPTQHLCDTLPTGSISGQSTAAIVDGTENPIRDMLSLEQERAAAVIIIEDGASLRLCSGTLVSPTHILTAAHCVLDTANWDGAPETVEENTLSPENMCLGIDSGMERTWHRLTSVTVSPAVQGQLLLRNDLAVVSLNEELRIPGVEVEPIQLLARDTTPEVDATFYTAGYGATACDGTVDLSRGKSWATLEQSDQSREYVLLADQGRGTPTFGDSGAAALTLVGNEPRLSGVQSVRLDLRCDTIAAALLPSHRDWLDHILADFPGDAPPVTGLTQDCAEALECTRPCPFDDAWCALRCAAPTTRPAFDQLVNLLSCRLCSGGQENCTDFEDKRDMCSGETLCDDPTSEACTTCLEQACQGAADACEGI